MFKKITSIIALLALSLPVFASEVPERQELQQINLLAKKNPGFENGKSQWSASGGSFTLATSGGNLFVPGGASAVFNASASAQTLCSALVAPGSFLNGSGSIHSKTAATDYKLQVRDNSSAVLSEALIPASTSFQETAVSFPMPTSGTIKLCVVSQSNAADIALDQAMLGKATLVQLAQAQHYGSMSVTNCTGVTTWSTAGYNDQASGGTACTYTATGKLSAPSGAYMGFRTAFEPGEYLITTGNASALSASAVILGTRISNGTVSTKSPTKQISASAISANSGDTYSLTVTTPLSVSDFRFQVNIAAGTYSSDTTGANEFTFDVYKFPTQVETAVTPATSAVSWSGSVGGTTNLTSATFADFPGTGVITEKTNRNIGTVTASSVSNGVTWTPYRAGLWKVCVSGSVLNTAGGATKSLALFDGANVSLGFAQNTTNSQGGGSADAFNRCATLNIQSVGTPKTVKLQGAVSTSSIGLDTDPEWTIENLDQGISAPVLVGSVVTPSSGVENIVRLTVDGGTPGNACTSDPCTIRSQSGSAVTAVNRSSLGNFAVHFSAGTFSATPSCTTSANTASASIAGVIEASSTLVNVYGYAPGGATADAGWSIICMGPK